MVSFCISLSAASKLKEIILAILEAMCFFTSITQLEVYFPSKKKVVGSSPTGGVVDSIPSLWEGGFLSRYILIHL